MVPFFALLKFATPKDKILMAFGTFGAAVAGAAYPFFAVIFGTMINDFGPSATATTIVHDIGKTSIEFIIVGAIVFFCAWIMFACWMRSGEEQAVHIRRLYFQALLRQEIGWFDRINPSELASQVVQQCTDI
jgi:ATP-binding cassette subfamily B (MDR/TAP) protein 1